MVEGEGGARRLSRAQREVLRLRVVAALESGQVSGYRRAAQVFRVCERSVGSWWRAYRRDGRQALAVRRRWWWSGRPARAWPGEPPAPRRPVTSRRRRWWSGRVSGLHEHVLSLDRNEIDQKNRDPRPARGVSRNAPR
ncbi:helix-turn-helix domain-containing protein [Gandjariella thermophila]|uniref:helix-turn-helix domain-containing protein n=1 Tax=Gandjariella thermophila TaxID=1931992 RepID=UPI0010F84D34